MINRAFLLPVWAFVVAGFVSAATGQAVAGEIVDRAAEAESFLQDGKPVKALGAAEAAYDATWRAIPLSFTKALFAASAPEGFGRYTPRENAVFSAGDEIVVYAEPVGYAYGEGANGFSIDLDADLDVRTASGQILASQTGFSRLSYTSPIRERAFNVTLTFAFDGLKPGDYVLAVTLRDTHSDKSGSFELPFTIAAPAPQSRPAED